MAIDPNRYHGQDHAARHKSGGADEIKLHELGAPTADVPFNGQKATGLAAPTAPGDAARKDEVDACEKIANKGVANGYAELDASGDVPLAQIPDTLTGKDADSVDGKHAADLVQMSGDQTIAGKKTFSTIPETTGGDPTADNQLARKAYVDAQIGGVAKAFIFNPEEFTTPESNPATLDIKGVSPVLVFADAGVRNAHLNVRVPAANMTIEIIWSTTVTSGDCKWQIDYLQLGDSVVYDALATNASVTDVANATAKARKVATIALSGLTEGETLSLKLFRDPTDVADTLSADAFMHALVVRPT